jgi:hypothetical protein
MRAGAFGETIARFRRSPRLVEGLRAIESEEPFEPELEGGVLLEEWPANREKNEGLWRQVRSLLLPRVLQPRLAKGGQRSAYAVVL